jgi:outer membrane receptor protein involved in Fe transport
VVRAEVLFIVLGVVLSGGSAYAEDEYSKLPDTVEVTATRVPEAIDNIPASITVVTGRQLRAVGAVDLRTALSLVGGVEGTPGGDAGPAGSVPALWGLREADAFLLVVDNVPWGGAFNPATPSIDMTGVARIEILRGAAPVMFGATSFVGVIHVIHDAAGEAQSTIEVSGASQRGGRAALQTNLSALGDYRQSLALNIERRGFEEDRTELTRYHALYRGAVSLAGARFHVDGDVSILPQTPSGNLLLRDGPVVHSELPIDANFNPAGARLDQARYHLALGLDGGGAENRWGVTLAVTRTMDDIFRGFLRGEAFVAPPDAGVGDGLQADGYSQTRGITDVYFDAHIRRSFGPRLNMTYGIDHLHGLGSEHAINFGYCIDPLGHEYACDGAHHPDELVESRDQREFSGLYAQVDYQPTGTFDLLGGLRLNRTWESASGQAIDNTGATPVIAFTGSESQSHTRLSGVLGASWHAWVSGHDTLTLYGDYRNSFKPLAIDFGPEAEVEILQPETADSVELGARMRLLDAALDLDMSVFRMDFRNGLTFAANDAGEFVRANGGSTRFQGFEIEAKYAVSPSLQLLGHFASHDARFRSYTRDNGADASGNRVEMSPRALGGLGAIYTGASGAGAALVANLVGSRLLNKSNTVEVGSYLTLDANLSYRIGRCTLRLSGYNLTDRRDPVAESELQEAVTVTGTAGYYRMAGRSLLLGISVPLAGG